MGWVIKETGGRTALPIFWEIMTRAYADHLVGTVPQFPQEMDARINVYLSSPTKPETAGPIAALAPLARAQGRALLHPEPGPPAAQRQWMAL